MEKVPDNETKWFTFTWTIQNFTYCLQKIDGPLLSPSFKLNLLDTNEWFISIYPRGIREDDRLGMFLDLLSSGPFPIKVNSYFSIRAKNGTFKRRRNESHLKTFEEDGGLGVEGFLTQCELYKKGEDSFLENDTLTLRCRIREEPPDPPVSGQCYARTVIDVKRIAFVWTLENFKELLYNKKSINFHTASSENQSFTVDILLSGEFYNEKKIKVQIKQNSPYQNSFVTCKLSLLDVDGKTSQSIRDEHWFVDSQKMLNLDLPLIPAKKVLENEKLYLVNGALSLRCEFAVSSGVKYSEVERTEYCELEQLDKTYSNKTFTTSIAGSLKDNWQNFYKEGKFSDLTVRTPSSKDFPVHKAVLCARSEVFRAMFDHDTKENRTGIVEIKDLNDDTVEKMLLFIYTDIVEDLEWKAASELYFAADKYGIVALKRECSTFLKGNLTSSNVCEVLVLADLHLDQDMKSAVQDFVMDNATEIINSAYWTKFIKDQSNLAAETMHLLCMRNFKI